LLRDTESDLQSLFSRTDETSEDSEQRPLLMRVAVRGTEKELGRLRDKLEEWLEECAAIAESGEDRDDAIAYAGLLAFYPQLEERDA